MAKLGDRTANPGDRATELGKGAVRGTVGRKARVVG